MSDPKRWVDEDGGSSALEQELLRAGQSERMPLDQKKRRWAAIAEQAALSAAASAPAPRGGAGTSGAASGLAKGGWVKSLSTLALLAGAGAGAWAVSHRGPREPTAAHASAPTTRIAAPLAAPGAGAAVGSAHSAPAAKETALEAAPSPKSAPVVPGHTVVPAQNSRLAEEARTVLDARTELERGNPAAALHLLEAARVDFPNGSLGQEREALAIEALAASGRKDAASVRARAFLRRFPGSPHASNVGRFVVQP